MRPTRVADWLFSAVVTFLSWLTIVALFRCVLPPAARSAAAWALGTLLAVGLPLAVDAWITRRYRRLEARARGTYATTLVVWNGLALLVLALGTPQSARAAMPGALVETAAALHLPTRPVAAVGSRVFRAPSAVEPSPSPSSPSSAVASSSPPPSPVIDAGAITTTSLIAAGAQHLPEPTTAAGRVFRDRAASVVVIHTTESTDESVMGSMLHEFGIEEVHASGSGFVAKSDGTRTLIVTNHHVAGKARSLQVVLKDGRAIADARLVARSKENDLAVVEVDVPNLPVAPLAEADDVQPGARAIAIGAPLGLEYTLTEGIVSARRTIGKTSMLQTQTTIDHGSSGGPLFDESGTVIGVNTATKGAGLNLAISTKHVRDLLAAPSKPKVLGHYAPGPTLKELALEGGSLSAIDRMQLEDICSAIFAVAEKCFTDLPDHGSIELRVPAEPLRGIFPSRSGAKTGARCFDSTGGEWLATALGMKLREAIGESVKNGGTARLVIEVPAQDGGAPKEVELRYVFEK